ncbi:MAG: hypothetical protein R3349_04940, partial [Geminicoccaceae bacterium]|nr:hypothetical protein [Geminicoccaceae bacterium]
MIAPDRDSRRWLAAKLWPRTFGGRLTLTLVIGVILVQALAVIVLVDDRREVERGIETRVPLDQLMAVLNLFAETPASERDLLTRAVASRTLAVELHEERPPGDPDLEQPAGLEPIARTLESELGAGVEVIAVGQTSGWRHDHAVHGPGLLPSHQRMVVLARLTDGTWIELASPLRFRPPFRPFRLLVWLGLIGLIVMVAGRLVARRFARPLERLAKAADRLGTEGT